MATDALSDVGFTADPSVKVGHLNLFERKQVDLARALVTRPRLLMLDEFLAGLGDKEVEFALSMLRQLKESGVVVIIIEHVMRALMAVSDRVIALDRGRLIADGDPEAVSRSQQVIEAYLGTGWSQSRTHV